MSLAKPFEVTKQGRMCEEQAEKSGLQRKDYEIPDRRLAPAPTVPIEVSPDAMSQ